jgi:hypothetical protein
VDEVAEAAADAALAAVEAAARLAEVGDGGQLAVDGAARVPAAVERVAGLLRVLFVLEAHVDVADEIWGFVSACFGRSFLGYGLTIIVVVAHDQLLDQPVLAQLAPDVLVEGVKVHLHLLRVHLVLGVIRRVLVQVGQEDRLRVRRLDVLSRAAVAVAAGADLVVEGAVDLVLLRSENGGEVVRHFCGAFVCRRCAEIGLWEVSDQCGCAGGGDGVVVVVVRLRKQWIVALEVHAEASATKCLVIDRQSGSWWLRAPSTTFTPHSYASPIRRNVFTPAIHDSSLLCLSARCSQSIEPCIDYNIEAFHLRQQPRASLFRAVACRLY